MATKNSTEMKKKYSNSRTDKYRSENKWLIYFLLLFLFSPFVLLAQSFRPDFSADKYIVQPPVELMQAGIIHKEYKYQKIAVFNGHDINAIVKLVGLASATVVNVDNPTNGGGGLDNRFQPVVSTSQPGGYAEWTISFFQEDFKTPIVQLNNFQMEALDIDGYEFVQVKKNYNCKWSGSEIDVSEDSEFIKFQGRSYSDQVITPTHTQYVAVVKYLNQNMITFRTGNSKTASNRQYSISFLGELTPPITSSYDPPVVCMGSSLTLSTSISGVSWYSSNPSVATININTGVVTPQSPGVTDITYVLPNQPANCASTSLPFEVTVKALPLASATINGSSSVCMGAAITLSTTALGNITWNSSNTAIATIHPSTGVVTPVTTGTTNITYTVTTQGAGCSATSAPKTVTVNPLPTASASTALTASCKC